MVEVGKLSGPMLQVGNFFGPMFEIGKLRMYDELVKVVIATFEVWTFLLDCIERCVALSPTRFA